MQENKHTLHVEWAAESWPMTVEVRKAGGARLGDLRDFFPEQPAAAPLMRLRQNCATNPHLRYRAFTLVEMLVVIAIIAILAGILLPALARGKVQAKVKNTLSEMGNIATAIAAYETDYSRPPAGKAAESSSTTAGRDFTFGDTGINSPAGIVNGPPHNHEANNSELMAILTNEDRAPNANFARNPRKVDYFNPKMVTGLDPGLSTTDYVLRDAFGNPYIITLDMNDDNKCQDAFYGRAVVSQSNGDQGYYGLVRPSAAAPFELNGPVMIWTAGPDRNFGDVKANVDPNKDNILSWRP